MTVAQYSSKHKISKQAVYDRLRRGTLSSKVIDGVKQIIDPDLETVKPVVDIDVESDEKKLLEKALKRLNKSKKIVKLLKRQHASSLKELNKGKRKIEVLNQKVEGDSALIKSLHSEIDTLKKSLSTLSLIVNSKIMQQLPPVPDADIVESKKKKKKKKKRK